MIDIEFSRHSKRRMKLYDIDENDIIKAINDYSLNNKLFYGRHDILDKSLSVKYVYPIKIIFSVENGKIVVISVFPFKRGYKNEDIL